MNLSVKIAVFLTLFLGATVWGSGAAGNSAVAKQKPDDTNAYAVAAYYWPAYHDEPRWRPFFNGTEGEWDIIRNARPKFPGHNQPRVPLWGYEDESDPKVMEKKIHAAVSHGINVLIFDWYWYEGQPFLEECLNKGFLKATNNGQIGFYLMWANHDATTLWSLQRSHTNEVIWPAAVDRKTFDVIADRVIAQYFKHPSYFKIDGKPVFSIYEISTLIKGLGGVANTRAALDGFREKVKAAGFPGLHLQAILWGTIPASLSMVPGDRAQTQDNTIRQLGFDSLSNYQWCHLVTPKGDYTDWGRVATAKWETWTKEFSVPYYPHVSIDWDSNPRARALRPNIIENKSPEEFAEFLKQAKEFVGRHNLKPRLITINSWNEWSEGSYLEPDTQFGMRYLEAVKAVFPPPTATSKP